MLVCTQVPLPERSRLPKFRKPCVVTGRIATCCACPCKSFVGDAARPSRLASKNLSRIPARRKTCQSTKQVLYWPTFGCRCRSVRPAERAILKGPLFVDTNSFFLQGLREVIERLRTASHHVEEVRVGPVDRIPKDGDESGLRDVASDFSSGSRVVKVGMGRFTDGFLARGTSEQLLICSDVGHSVGCVILLLRGEKVGFLDRAHVDLRVLLEVIIECCSPRLHRAYDEKVRHRHGLHPLISTIDTGQEPIDHRHHRSPSQAVHYVNFSPHRSCKVTGTKPGSLAAPRAHELSSTTAANVGNSAKLPPFPCSIKACGSGCNIDQYRNEASAR